MEQQPAAPQPIVPELKPYPISVEVIYPEKLSRLTTFFRGIIIIPQSIVLSIISIIAGIVSLIAWFAILFTGKYPRGLFNYNAGVLRWTARVSGYASYLTDKYPPFGMN